MMLLIFQAMIRSALYYGCFVYGSASKTVLARLHAVQARALVLCCGAFSSCTIHWNGRNALMVKMY